MAHLKRVNNQGRIYYYIVQSRRRSGRVTTKILEYLGRDPEPKRLQRAKRYWGVKPGPKTNRRNGGTTVFESDS